MQTFNTYFQSPIGWVEIKGTHEHVTSVMVYDEAKEDVHINSIEVLELCKQELQQYFAGTLQQFTVPLAPQGTAFQQQVWRALTGVPYGCTASYRDIAIAIANPKGVRAVGLANSKNPLAIIVPCHRVIGANGTLTGYAGGLDKKAWLLQHEEVTGLKW
mgnify:CR=1 FL=1